MSIAIHFPRVIDYERGWGPVWRDPDRPHGPPFYSQQNYANGRGSPGMPERSLAPVRNDPSYDPHYELRRTWDIPPHWRLNFS
jgi:hypothetical protein